MNVDLQREDFNYGGIYRAVVLDNADPLKLGRVKVNVFEIYDGITAANLPWAASIQSIGPGAGAGFGVFAVPEIGSFVFVMFEGGDIYQPVVVGSAPDAVHGLPSERSTNYPSRLIIKTKNGTAICIDGVTGDVSISATGNVTITGNRIDLNP